MKEDLEIAGACKEDTSGKVETKETDQEQIGKRKEEEMTI